MSGARAPERDDRTKVRAAVFLGAGAGFRVEDLLLDPPGPGEVVLLRRGIEPGRGLWAQPGGFMEIDETVHEGAIRETFEETGLIVEPGEVVGLYTRPEAAIVVIAFVARIVGGAPTVTPEALEVRPFSPDAIPWPEIAFRTTEWALRDWVRRIRPDLEPDARDRQAPRG